MIIDEISGNVLTITRAREGTVLATHSIGTTIYVPRTLTVERGALGTTASTHTTSSAITVWVPPSLIEELTIAETVNMLMQGGAAWGRTIGAGENTREFRGSGLSDLRRTVIERYGRRVRVGAV